MASARLFRGAVVVGTLLAAALCAGIAAQAVVLGSREGRWLYGYLQPFRPSWLVVAALATAACASLLAASDVPFLREDWKQILLWMLVALGVQALVRSLTLFSFDQLFASDSANSFYGVTRRYFASTVLRDFDDLHNHFPMHAQSNMPGKLMLVYALKSLSRRPVVLAWLVVVISNFGGVLTYVYVRDWFDDGRTALYAAVLYLFVPAKMFFFPLLNTVTPVVVLACACLLSRWIRTRRPAYAVLFGASLYGLVFFEPVGLVMGLLFAVQIVAALRQGTVSWRTCLRHAGLAAVGFAVCYVGLAWRFGFDLASAARAIAAGAVEFNRDEGRPYAIWLGGNLREFLFGVGICQAVLFGAALVDGLRAPKGARNSQARTAAIVCLGLLGVLAVTDLTGVNRGEVMRLWIFLACFFQIPAAYVCARLESRLALALVLAVTLLQGVLGTAMIGFVST
jgi:methylthioxylose transferase